MTAILLISAGFLGGVLVYRYYARWRIQRQLKQYLPELLERPVGPLFPALRSLLSAIRSVLDRYQKMEQTYQASMKQIRSILDALPWPIIMVNHDGIVWYWNQIAAEWFQIPEEGDFHREPLYYWMIVDAPDLQEKFRAILEEKKSEIFTWTRYTPGGRQFLEIRFIPVPHLIPPSLAVLFVDLTEQERFQKYRTEMAELILHELRTPLTGIQTAMELLEAPDAPTRKEALSILRRQIRRLEQFTSRLDILTTAERPLTAPPETVDLVSLIKQTIQEIEDVYHNRSIHIEARLPDSAPFEGWPQLLRVIVANLLDNACKYSKPGSSVEISLVREQNAYTLTVDDRGPGIPEHEKKRIFQRFYRGQFSRQAGLPGSGLGLSLVKHAVEKHEGTVRCLDRPGGGSRFEVILPIRSN